MNDVGKTAPHFKIFISVLSSKYKLIKQLTTKITEK